MLYTWDQWKKTKKTIYLSHTLLFVAVATFSYIGALLIVIMRFLGLAWKTLHISCSFVSRICFCCLLNSSRERARWLCLWHVWGFCHTVLRKIYDCFLSVWCSPGKGEKGWGKPVKNNRDRKIVCLVSYVCIIFKSVLQASNRQWPNPRRVSSCLPTSSPCKYRLWLSVGDDPEQARLVREFMFGVGEIVTGIFCVSVGGVLFSAGGITILFDGGSRVFTSLNSLWANHQTELQALKEWEQTALKPAVQ